MKAIDRMIDLLSFVFMAIAAIALTLMMGHVTVDVAGKYLLNAPVPVTLEMVSNYYMVAVVFLPLAAAERRIIPSRRLGGQPARPDLDDLCQ